jgi:hypothetical protein
LLVLADNDGRSGAYGNRSDEAVDSFSGFAVPARKRDAKGDAVRLAAPLSLSEEVDLF